MWMSKEREKRAGRNRSPSGWRVRSECDARRSLTQSGAIPRAEHELQGLTTPRHMAAAQVVRQPIRRAVSFGSLTVGGCLTPERPADPCWGIPRGLGLHCTLATWGSPHPRQRGGAVQSGLGCTRTETLGGGPSGVHRDHVLPVFVPAVDPWESTGTMPLPPGG